MRLKRLACACGCFSVSDEADYSNEVYLLVKWRNQKSVHSERASSVLGVRRIVLFITNKEPDQTLHMILACVFMFQLQVFFSLTTESIWILFQNQKQKQKKQTSRKHIAWSTFYFWRRNGDKAFILLLHAASFWSKYFFSITSFLGSIIYNTVIQTVIAFVQNVYTSRCLEHFLSSQTLCWVGLLPRVSDN